MQEIEGQTYFRRVESGVLFWQPPLPLHMEHEVASTDELNDEKQPRGRLKTRVKTNQERMVGRRLKHMLLRLHPVNVLQIKKRVSAANE